MNPRVSVVIPTYNRSHFIADAIESCYAAADGLDIQVVVVDDASTDDSETIIKRYPATYIRFDKNQGRCNARNVGKASSNGLYVKFLDSDDTLEPGSLRREYELAEKENADIVISGWHVAEGDRNGHEVITRTFSPPAFNSHIDNILAGDAVPTSSALYRRDYIYQVEWVNVGPLDDWDFFIHAAIRMGKIVSLNEPAYRWRQHSGERASGQPMLVTAECFYKILDRLYEYLSVTGQLTEARRKRLAQYYYKELRVLFRYKSPLASKIEERIFSLDPDFVPRDEERSTLIKALARLMPLHLILATYGVIRRAMDTMGKA